MSEIGVLPALVLVDVNLQTWQMIQSFVATCLDHQTLLLVPQLYHLRWVLCVIS